MRRATACVLLLVLALAAGGRLRAATARRDDAAAAARARAEPRGRRDCGGRQSASSRKHCAPCHTIEGRAPHPTFIESPIPNLDEVKPRADYVRGARRTRRLRHGRVQRTKSPAQFDAVVAYVADVAGSRVVDAGRRRRSSSRRASRSSAATAQRCHAIDGRRATGRPSLPGHRLQPREAERAARDAAGAPRGIPEEMPSFRGRLTREQLQAVAAYVTDDRGGVSRERARPAARGATRRGVRGHARLRVEGPAVAAGRLRVVHRDVGRGERRPRGRPGRARRRR